MVCLALVGILTLFARQGRCLWLCKSNIWICEINREIRCKMMKTKLNLKKSHQNFHLFEVKNEDQHGKCLACGYINELQDPEG